MKKYLTRIAALSAAAMLLTGCAPSAPANTPAETLSGSAYTAELEELKQENAELRQQLELQKQQIKDLRAKLNDLNGEAPADQTDEQAEAFEIFQQIQAAYADFDREKLEELIPEMDKRLTYLGDDALYEYYQILEYVEQPSNG